MERRWAQLHCLITRGLGKAVLLMVVAKLSCKVGRTYSGALLAHRTPPNLGETPRLRRREYRNRCSTCSTLRTTMVLDLPVCMTTDARKTSHNATDELPLSTCIIRKRYESAKPGTDDVTHREYHTTNGIIPSRYGSYSVRVRVRVRV